MRCHAMLLALLLACLPPLARPATQPPADVVTVDAAPAHRITSFRPMLAFGSTVDKEPAGSISRLYSQRNIRAMLDAGLGWLSYRLFTELSVQDWHWNPEGMFSAGDAGYWTSSASTARAPIVDSFGYRLPHSGFTSDQGNNEGYSRLDDGDARTYWKSDPYLAQSFTGDADSSHPQWIVIDLETPHAINAIRLAWANPYATQYAIERWTGGDAINDPGHGRWIPFPRGKIAAGRGGIVTIELANRPLSVRFLRVIMKQSSNTCDTHGGNDRRNCAGYAVNEVYAGTLVAKGALRDVIHHAPCGGERPGRYACGVRQTGTYVSSVDPWHRASDRVRNQEQPGLDLIARSGLTRDLGATYPVPMLYSTPENAVAEIRYLRARGYPIARIELGEEPDGQYISPEDDAALYIQWARAIHAYDPSLKLGGPVFSGVNSDLQTWPDTSGSISWLTRFLRYLRAHGHLNDLAFMSFEHYPFYGCEHGAKLQADLIEEPSLIAGIAKAWRGDGLPDSTPMFITEANFSAANFTQTPMQIEGALWQADYMASSISNGISGVVYYQYEPVPLSQNKQCPSDWGNLTMFDADIKATIRARAAQFYAVQMLTRYWVQPGDALHELYRAKASIAGSTRPLVTAYAVKRPDGTWSVLLVNKDTRPHDVSVTFAGTSSSDPAYFTGTVTRTTFGKAQYVWRSRGARSGPDPNDEPALSSLSATQTYRIPALSITVLRGHVASPR